MPLPSVYTTPKFIKEYTEHQANYMENPRESDLKFMEIIRSFGDPSMALLDMGCNTGNLLRMIQKDFPRASLHGVDLVPDFIANARELSQHEDFKDIKYSVSDMGEYKAQFPMDIVSFNASVMCLEDTELVEAWMQAYKNMRDGGHLIVFDYFHPHVQNIEIRESHNNDEILHFRSYDLAKNICRAVGFSDIQFIPFSMNSERLPKEGTTQSYTRRFSDGENASFRGTLYQPWCFLTARKS